MNTPLKVCFKCGLERPITEFYRHSAMGDGHLGKCKECTKADASKHRAANIEKARKYDKERASLPHRVALRKSVIAIYAEQFPNRIAANNAVSNAVRDGRLQRQPCFICGEKAVAHHPDYDAPLSVVWLCQAHHKQAHALVGKEDSKTGRPAWTN